MLFKQSLILFQLFWLPVFSIYLPDIHWLRPDKDFALLIGVDQFEDPAWSNLKNPVKDIQTIAKELRDNYGFKVETVENPNKRTIYEKLDKYARRSYNQEDQLLIFLSGHGYFKETGSEGFFVAKDGKGPDEDVFGESFIPHSRLREIISQIPCEHILLAVDACFSGTFDREIALDKGLGDRPNKGRAAIKIWLEENLKYTSRFYLTSGGKERTSDGISHSPFTTSFLEALRSYGGSDEDGVLTFNELASYMERTQPDRPRFGTFDGHKPGGNFFFIRSDLSGLAAEKLVSSSEDNELKGQSKGAAQPYSAEQDLAFWRDIKDKNDLDSFKSYLERFPEGAFTEQARSKVAALEAPLLEKQAEKQDDLAWEIALEKNTEAAYREYGENFPEGKHSAAMNEKLAELEWPNVLTANSLKAYREFVSTHQGTQYSQLAIEKMASVEWEETKKLNAISSYIHYFERYPSARDNMDISNELDQRLWAEIQKNPCVLTYSNYFKLLPEGSRAEEVKQYLTQKAIVDPAGNWYEKVKFGDLYWTIQNMNFPYAGSYCNDCDESGRLYTWEAANETCKLLGEGWRLPSKEEFDVLEKEVPGKKNLWETGESGFALQLSNYLSFKNIQGLPNGAYLWSSTLNKKGDEAWFFLAQKDFMLFNARYQSKNDFAVGCRCVKEASKENSTAASNNRGSRTEAVDPKGKKYPTINIGELTWMTQNLDFPYFGAQHFGNEPHPEEPYGRLYSWKAAQATCSLLGTGWRLPTEKEWKNVISQYGGYKISGGKNQTGWKTVGGDPLTAGKALLKGGNSGLNLLLGGYNAGNSVEDIWIGFNMAGTYWAHDAYGPYGASSIGIFKSGEPSKDFEVIIRAEGYTIKKSVRCVNGPNPPDQIANLLVQPDSYWVIDGSKFIYPTKKLNGSYWTSRNFMTPLNGSVVYNNDNNNWGRYGRLYDWETAKRACASLGQGWRLPTKEEWEGLNNIYGDQTYESLIFRGESGFHAQLSGYMISEGENKSFQMIDTKGLYWSTTEGNDGKVWIYSLDKRSGSTNLEKLDKNNQISCRCIKSN